MAGGFARRGQKPPSTSEIFRVIITADDFGLDIHVNKAVERAFDHGVLTTASLMVAAPAAADAVRRARARPGLGVGLHLVLTDGVAVLPPAEIPDLVDDRGAFDDHMARAGARFFLYARARAQLAAEIRAQFEAFKATGLTLDHVNAHKHFHLHPTIARLVLEIGRDYGLAAVRVPFERAGRRPWERPILGHGERLLVNARSRGLRRWLDRYALRYNDTLIGVRKTGHMNERALLAWLRALPAGVTEIYLHPATANNLTPRMAGYDHTGELAALLSPDVRARLNAGRVQRVRFADLRNG